MTNEPVLLTIKDSVATIRLNRPDVANALDLPTARRLRDIALTVASDPTVSLVVLSAAGKLFCAGGDVVAMAAAEDRGAFVLELAGTVHQALLTLRSLSAPIVAAVQGTAAGAGVGLVLAADLVIASDRARFVSAYADVGLTPDCGVSALLARVVGPRRAASFVLSGQPIDAGRALEWGLVTETCAHEDLDAEVTRHVAGLQGRPAHALGASALLLRGAGEQSYEKQLRDEAGSIARMARTPETGALLTRFAGERGPKRV